MPNGRGSAPPTRTCRRRWPATGRRSSPASAAGLQAVRNLLPDNTIQIRDLKPWTIGVTVTQTLFNGFKTANSVRVAELQVQSGREALRNVGQGVLLDAVTAYTNVLANQSLVEAQRANVAFLRETLGITQKRLNAGDVTPTDTAQAEARLNRGLPISTPPKSISPSARRPTPR
jgi:outer membrane protein